MKRRYTFFDKEALDGHPVTYDFPPPFEANLDEYLKSTYGDSLAFVKEINHRDRVIRLYSAYDSGKGTRYVAALTKEELERGRVRTADLSDWTPPPRVEVDYSQYSLADLPELCKNPENKLIALNVYKRNTPGADLRQTAEYISELMEKMKTA